MANFSHGVIDGYPIDLSAGATKNQVLKSDGTVFKAASDKLTQAYYDLLTVSNNTGSAYAGNYTQGCKFIITTCPSTITGAKFYFPENVARTVRFRLWTAAGVALGIGTAGALYYDYAVSVAGLYTVTFPTLYAVTPPLVLVLSQWESSGTKYYEGAPLTPVTYTYPPEGSFYQSGPNFAWVDVYLDHAGDAFPSTSGAGTSGWCPMMPVWTTP